MKQRRAIEEGQTERNKKARGGREKETYCQVPIFFFDRTEPAKRTKLLNQLQAPTTIKLYQIVQTFRQNNWNRKERAMTKDRTRQPISHLVCISSNMREGGIERPNILQDRNTFP